MGPSGGRAGRVDIAALRTGDPADEATDVGPLINEDAARRVEAWVDEAVASGAKVLTGGVRDGVPYAPTVIVDAPADAKVCAEEVFGPVLVLSRAESDEAAFAAHRRLEVDGVIVGDVPSFRADQMPYGGMKGSGVGREGVRSAMDDCTEPRVLVFTGVDL